MDIKFEPRACWLGLEKSLPWYRAAHDAEYRDYYLCLIPMIPIHWQTRTPVEFVP